MKPETFTLVCERQGETKVLTCTAPKRYAVMVARLGIGEEVTARYSQARGLKANSKLHGVLGEVAEALGWDASEFKEFIVTKLRPLEEDRLTGFVRRQKTHLMSDDEIDKLVTEIKAWTVHHLPGFIFEFDTR